MNCPEEVAQAILEIMQKALLAIRIAGWQNDSHYCALEADHIHNLPGLISGYRDEKLQYYLEVERVSYTKRLSETGGNP